MLTRYEIFLLNCILEHHTFGLRFKRPDPLLQMTVAQRVAAVAYVRGIVAKIGRAIK